MHFVWEDVRCELLLKSMCHKVASLHCLHSRMTHHITLHTSYLYFLIPTLNLSNKFEMMRVDWESLKVSSCTEHSTPSIITSAKQLRSGQRNYTKTLFTLCTKIFTSVLDKIFSHWYSAQFDTLFMPMLTPARQQVRGKASPSPGFRLSCRDCGKKDAKHPLAILRSSYLIQ